MKLFQRHRHILYVFGGLLAGGVVVFLGYSAYLYSQSGIREHGITLEELPGFRGVHWHVKLEMSACGETLRLPLNRGTPLLHTHKDPEKIHIEGLIAEGDDVTLGEFMDAVGIPFSTTQLFAYENDNGCPDEASDQLHLLLNGKEDARFRDLPLRDGDHIILIYD